MSTICQYQNVTRLIVVSDLYRLSTFINKLFYRNFCKRESIKNIIKCDAIFSFHFENHMYYHMYICVYIVMLRDSIFHVHDIALTCVSLSYPVILYVCVIYIYRINTVINIAEKKDVY